MKYCIMQKKHNEEMSMGSGKTLPEHFVWEFRSKRSGKVMFFDSVDEAKIQIESDKMDIKNYDLPKVIERKIVTTKDIII